MENQESTETVLEMEEKKVTFKEDTNIEDIEDAVEEGGEEIQKPELLALVVTSLTADSLPGAASAKGRKALVVRDYQKNNVMLKEGDYVDNVEIGNHYLWRGTTEQGQSVLFPSENVQIIGTFRFFDLPGEARNNIYFLLVAPGYTITLARSPLPPVTQASRQLRHEALSLFYSRNTFRFCEPFTDPDKGGRSHPAARWSQFLTIAGADMNGTLYFNLIRRLEIHVGHCRNHGYSGFYCKIKSFPTAKVTLKWARNCAASTEVRHYVIERLREEFPEETLSGDMEHRVHCGYINLYKLFIMFDREGLEYKVPPWEFYLF